MTIQGYAKFFITAFIFIVFYSYAFSIYKRQRTGERDYEKYSSIVHDDAWDQKPLEDRVEKKIEKGEK
jgi:cytochrome c oxidase cbb3-type subunit 4